MMNWKLLKCFFGYHKLRLDYVSIEKTHSYKVIRKTDSLLFPEYWGHFEPTYARCICKICQAEVTVIVKDVDPKDLQYSDVIKSLKIDQD